MEDWKDIIVQRITDRKARQDTFDIILNKIDRILTKLLKDLSDTYHMKAKHNQTLNGYDSSWTIIIEDEKYSFNLEKVYQYFQNERDLENALIRLILENFKFE